MSFLKLSVFLFILSILQSCVQAPGISTFTELGRTINTKKITLTVSGMTNGMSAVVSTNGRSMTITDNGVFNFTPLQTNSSYNFIISSVTTGYNCEISNNVGVLTSNLSLTMTCGSLGPYTISAKISGLLASSVSLSNGSDSISNSPNGTYSFATSQEYGTSYNISVTLQPTAHTCAAVSGSGFVTGNMVINVVCTPSTFTLGGTYSGLEPAETLVLEVNSLVGSNTLTLNGVTSGVSTGFTFANGLSYNQAYSVKLVSQPANKVCTVTNNSGSIFNNISNVSVTCSTRVATNCSFGSITPWAGNSGFTSSYCDGTHVYVGGSFTGLGPQARHFAVINNTDANPIPDSRFTDSVAPNSINDRIVLSDGEGGWFTGGEDNGVHYGLRHFKNDLSLDPMFSSALYYISALKIVDNHLFVGSGSSNSLKKINRFTGVLDATFTPNVVGQIQEIEYDGTYLYVVGLITSAGGSAKKGITKIHATTGVVDHSFSLSLTSDAAQTTVTNVYTIKIYNSNLYIGGDFIYVNGNGTTPRLIKANVSGVLDATFTPSPNSSVYKLEVYQNKMLVAGQYTNIFSQSKRALAVIDVGGDHLLTSFFNESITGAFAEVNTMHLNSSNGLLYLAFNYGSINNVNGVFRGYYAVYDLNNKTVSTQEAKVNNEITSFASYGSQVFIAGYFTSVYRDTQSYFARINLSDGKRDTTFNPTVNGIVQDLKYDSVTNSLFLGGNFTSPSNYMAKYRFDTQTWDGSFTPTFNALVTKVHVYNNKIFTSGSFTTPRNYFAVVSPTTGAVDSGYPNLAPSDSRTYLYAVNSYGAFLGGFFSTIDSLGTSSFLARVDHSDGRVTDGYFPAVPSSIVNNIIPIGSTLIVGGFFTNYNGSGKSSGVLIEQNPSVSLDSTFNATLYGNSTASSCAIGSNIYFTRGTTNFYSINYTTGTPSALQSSASNTNSIQCQNSQYFLSGPGFFTVGP